MLRRIGSRIGRRNLVEGFNPFDTLVVGYVISA
jgi:hypothetical protein